MYKKIIVSTLFVSVIAACGYKGALYLPPKPKPALQPVVLKAAESAAAESALLVESALRAESTPRKSLLPALIMESTPVSKNVQPAN